MQVVITLTFENTRAYEDWLVMQAGTLQMRKGVVAPPLTLGVATQTEETQNAVKDTGRAEAVAPKKQRKPRTSKKASAKKEGGKGSPGAPTAGAQVGEVTTGPEEVLPAAPTTEAPAIEGEQVYTLADSREVLTAYLNKAGNGADTLIKELSVHGAKRINQVPREHIHGFLKRMVEAS